MNCSETANFLVYNYLVQKNKKKASKFNELIHRASQDRWQMKRIALPNVNAERCATKLRPNGNDGNAVRNTMTTALNSRSPPSALGIPRYSRTDESKSQSRDHVTFQGVNGKQPEGEVSKSSSLESMHPATDPT